MTTVLVIDDDELVRAFIQTTLERDGYDVVALPDGSAVAAALRDNDIDAVVIDLYMPNSDGIETLQQLNQLVPGIPVVCVTGSLSGANDPCAKLMALLGARVMLPKPVSSSVLRDVMARVLATPSSPDNGVAT